MDKNMEMANATIVTFMKAIRNSANLIYKDMEELYPYEMEQLSIIEDYMMLGYDANKRILQEKPVIQNLGCQGEMIHTKLQNISTVPNIQKIICSLL